MRPAEMSGLRGGAGERPERSQTLGPKSRAATCRGAEASASVARPEASPAASSTFRFHFLLKCSKKGAPDPGAAR